MLRYTHCPILIIFAAEISEIFWLEKVKGTKGKGTKVCIVPLHENLTPEALRYGSHSFFYTANTPYLPLPRKRSPGGATTG